MVVKVIYENEVFYFWMVFNNGVLIYSVVFVMFSLSILYLRYDL